MKSLKFLYKHTTDFRRSLVPSIRFSTKSIMTESKYYQCHNAVFTHLRVKEVFNLVITVTRKTFVTSFFSKSHNNKYCTYSIATNISTIQWNDVFGLYIATIASFLSVIIASLVWLNQIYILRQL